MKRWHHDVCLVAWAITVCLSLFLPSLAHACPPEEGCPTCGCPLLPFFDENALCDCTQGPDDSNQMGRHPVSVAVWGAEAVDKDGDGRPDVWRICLVCRASHPSLQGCGSGSCSDGSCGSACGSNVTDLVRFFERPWTPTGPYWEDYKPLDPTVQATAGRYRTDPKIIVKATKSGWQARRVGDSHQIVDPNGVVVVSSEWVNYRLSSSRYADGRRMDDGLDDQDRITNAVESVDGAVVRQIVRRFAENGGRTRIRKTEWTWAANGQAEAVSTIYGYWGANPPEEAGGAAAAGQLRYVLRPEAVASYLTTHPEAGVRTDDLQGECGLDTASDEALMPFASMEGQEYGWCDLSAEAWRERTTCRRPTHTIRSPFSAIG